MKQPNMTKLAKWQSSVRPLLGGGTGAPVAGHPHAELVAVTSRQYAGQTLAKVFPKFAHHPKAQALRFAEPNAAVLAKQAELVFLALPHGVAAEFAVPL